MRTVKVTAKADYAVRATLELATVDEGLVKGERISQAQGIPLKFLENILIDLRHAGHRRSQRGAEGGYRLARPATEVTLGEVIRAVEGPLASVRGEPPESVSYDGRRRAPADGLGGGAGQPAQRARRPDPGGGGRRTAAAARRAADRGAGRLV